MKIIIIIIIIIIITIIIIIIIIKIIIKLILNVNFFLFFRAKIVALQSKITGHGYFFSS